MSSDGRRSEVPVISRSVGDVEARTEVGFGVEAAAIEWDEGGFGEGGFADRAMARGGIEMDPPENTGPAVEVAAESDDRIGGEVEADITVEAGGRGGREFFRRGRGFHDEILEVAVQGPFCIHYSVPKRGKVLW